MKYHPIFEQYLSCKDANEVFNYLQTTFANSITMWDYFVNWGKVLRNVHEIEIDLNTLNYLVGKPDVKEELATLLSRQPQLVRSIPILLAARESNFEILIDASKGELKYKKFSFGPKESLTAEEISDICEFAQESGLLDLFRKKVIRSVPDYVLGVEVGLDTNARKNRGGTTMEKLIDDFVSGFCQTYHYEYIPQANAAMVKERWGINIQVDKSSRRFDFAVRKGEKLYLVETNFYGGGGSKLKSTAGEYRNLFNFLKDQNLHFIWITDGLGWKTTLRPLEEAFNHVDYILNLKMMMGGLFAEIINREL